MIHLYRTEKRQFSDRLTLNGAPRCFEDECGNRQLVAKLGCDDWPIYMTQVESGPDEIVEFWQRLIDDDSYPADVLPGVLTALELFKNSKQ